MIIRLTIALFCLTILMSCSKHRYCFNEHLTDNYDPDPFRDLMGIDRIGPFNNGSVPFYLAMKRTKIFQDGELSFKIEASHDPNEACNQFACFLFDDRGRVFYFTEFRDDIMEDLEDNDLTDSIPPMKDTIQVRKFRNAMQGRYAMNDQKKIVMILEKWGQKDPITLIGHIKGEFLVLDLINFKRETFPTVLQVELDGNKVNGKNDKRLRYYDLKDMFSIDTMKFKRQKFDPPVISYAGANVECYHDSTFWNRKKIEEYLGGPQVIPKYEMNQMRQSR